MLALKVSNFGLDRGYRQIGVNVSKGFFGLSGVWTLSNIKRVRTHIPVTGADLALKKVLFLGACSRAPYMWNPM